VSDLPTEGTCRIGGAACGPTIEAHLFPRALARDLRADHKHLYVGGVDAPGKRIVQAGLYDHHILCAEHDNVLGGYDDYGIDFCRTFAAKRQHPDPNIWRIEDVNADLLVKFWLAILWRFSISSLPEAAKVQLGPHDNRFRDILFGGADCSVEPAIIMVRYRSVKVQPENICFVPYRSKFPAPSAHLNGYGIAVAGLLAFVKVDGQRLAPQWHETTINGKSVIHGGYLDFEQTNQFQAMLTIVRNMGMKPQRNKRRG
jgi:hypothetical protein